MQAWRAQRELWLPRFPREKIAEIENTLEYPADGSATGTGGTAMTRRLAVAGLLAAALALSAAGVRSHCTRRCSATTTLSVELEYELLLVNIGRLRHGLPVHFTVTSSIAATFDYQTNAAILGPVSDIGLSVGVSAAENPTLSIVPIQGSSSLNGC